MFLKYFSFGERMKLWETENTETEKIVEEYTSSKDVGLDQNLVEDDILGNIAHTQMLFEQGFLNENELSEIHSSLLEIYESEVQIDTDDEDVHGKIENLVTERTEAGKKIHTARSRNDQILLDTRIYSKRKIIDIAFNIISLIDEILGKAKEHEDLIMPGYTHMRQAMPMTAYLWLTSYVESLIDDLKLLNTAFELNNQNPLGAAAGYGTSLQINRERTTELLKFNTVQQNPLYCVNSRGKIELEIISALSQVMLDLNLLSNDLILFSTQEFNFIDLPEEFCTGSSIMPQKSNPDVLEILKGKTADLISKEHQIELILKNNNLGFNRDTQETKEPLMKGIEITNSSLTILKLMIPKIRFNKKEIRKKMKKSTYAAYTANKKVKNGIPFREAYKKTKKEEKYEKPKTEELMNYEFNENELNKVKNSWKKKKKKYRSMIHDLLSLAEENSKK